MTESEAKVVVDELMTEIGEVKGQSAALQTADVLSELCSEKFKKICKKTFGVTDGILASIDATELICALIDAEYNSTSEEEKNKKLIDATESLLKISSKIVGLTPGVGALLGDTVDMGAACLNGGMKVVNTRVEQLRDCDEAIKNSSVSGVKTAAKNLKGTKEDMEALNYALGVLERTKGIYVDYGVDCSELEGSIRALKELRLQYYAQQAKTLKEINELLGRNYVDLEAASSALMRAADDIYDNAGKVVVDPLILDLDNNGYDITSQANGTHFDLDGNGIIDDGTEVFGDNHVLKNLIKSA